MKQTLYIIVSLVFLLNISLDAQTILKKKEVKEKLILISDEIDKKNYEIAMNILFSKEEVILSENIKRKYKEKYNNLNKILKTKKIEFDNKKGKVSSLLKDYKSFNFDKAFELIEMPLTKENSYIETQKVVDNILPQLKKGQKICEENKKNILKWKQNFQNHEYENLFFLFILKKSETDCFYDTDFIELEKLQNKLKPIFEKYNTVYNNVIVLPTHKILSVSYYNLTIEKYNKYIKELKFYLVDINSERNTLIGKFPKLDVKIIEIKNRLNKVIQNLEENKPLTTEEVKKLIFSGKWVSIDFIKKNCYYIKEDGYDKCSEETYDIYNLDIFKMHPDIGTKSELQQEAYKETNEYKKQFEELNELRKKMISTSYISFNPFEYSEYLRKYNLDTKAFEIRSTAISGYKGLAHSDTNPPKCIYSVEFLQFPYIIKERKEMFDGKRLYYQIKMPTKIALKIENNSENVNFIFLFDIKSKYNKKYKFKAISWFNNDKYYTTDLSQDIFKTNVVRVIIYNTLTDEIYFDKVYN